MLVHTCLLDSLRCPRWPRSPCPMAVRKDETWSQALGFSPWEQLETSWGPSQLADNQVCITTCLGWWNIIKTYNKKNNVLTTRGPTISVAVPWGTSQAAGGWFGWPWRFVTKSILKIGLASQTLCDQQKSLNILNRKYHQTWQIMGEHRLHPHQRELPGATNPHGRKANLGPLCATECRSCPCESQP